MSETQQLQVRATDLTDADQARLLAPKLKALADETRLTIMLLLAQRPHTVSELPAATQLEQALIRYPPAPLRGQQLISVAARGRANVYSLCCDQLGEPVRWLATLPTLTPQGAAACCVADPGDATDSRV